MLRIGVELGDAIASVGDFVADARALEAAGVDTIWVRDGPLLDPWTRLGALGATTYRVRLGILDLDPSRGTASAMASTLTTLETLAAGRLSVGVGDAGSIASLRRLVPESVRVVLVSETGDAPERWVRIPMPAGRAEWRATREAQKKAGATGIVVPMGPRLLDLLRNPDTDDDRSDLRIAVG